ncbi:pimeloyl-ACP methyl ester carboxylesterase [Aquimarina sp. EL_43]|uniref:alpha/beta hydrolase n=1 Tax=Aquimarina TaxID=290174 RepID=UPI00046EDBC7|nr:MULTISPECIES: alpha/beta hydrolase [Aquimarina]MBG6128590.1 pimeloyl-ACP methyl ester carboxylesterase [Aquimarina sp. EL_35]MBG6149653.1 pimeloyl-ACP methyl ester carboxylesterase [Aquimarina sp. EL_32]MBG6167662.1 pimeloyl-ACP methyl ester carboxylesterase [Aquimarina sp. EL_43]
MKEKYKKYLPLIIGKYIQFLFLFYPKKAINKAYILFCTPRKGKILPEQEDFLEEAEDEMVLIDTIYIQTYRWSSMGETILLVHGWESNTHRWKVLIQKLHKKGFNVIAFDAPAHGNSTGKILNVPLYTKCLQKIVELYRPNHMIGHSVGGMATIFHQYTYQNKEIEKLIVLAPPSELSRIMKGYQEVLKLSPKFMKALNHYFKEKHGFYFDEFSMVNFAKNLVVKGLLIHDKNDDIAPYSEAESISKNWNNAQFITTENYGHSLFFDEVDNMIIDFLKA